MSEKVHPVGYRIVAHGRTQKLVVSEEVADNAAQAWRASDPKAFYEPLYAAPPADEALMRQVLEALDAAEFYIGQLETVVYSKDDFGVHEDRQTVRDAIAALLERLKGEER